MVNGRDYLQIYREKEKKRTGKVNFVLFRSRSKINEKRDQNASSLDSYRLWKTVALHMLFLILFTNYILLGAVRKKKCILKTCMWVIS